MNKTWNNKAWFMVAPVLLLVLFSAAIPLMTVVNYSVQDTFGNNVFFWAGTEWFEQVLESSRFREALIRNLVFSFVILAIEIPLGIFIALNMPRRGIGVPICLVLMALPLLIPWNVVGTIWQVFGRVDIGLLGKTLNMMGVNYTYATDPTHAWVTIVVMDVWHWTSLVVLLCYAGLVSIPGAYYQAAKIDGASRWSVFRFIQLPKMHRVLLIAVLLRFMDSFMIYTEPFVVTGGGPGVMEAGNRGAADVGAPSIGLNIVLAHEQAPNLYVTPELCFNFHYFAIRKMHFVMRAKAVAVFPGGFGTMDELFETLTLIQTGRMERVPVLLFGKEFWEHAINLDYLAEQGTISPGDQSIIDYVDTAAEAWDVIARFYEHP